MGSALGAFAERKPANALDEALAAIGAATATGQSTSWPCSSNIHVAGRTMERDAESEFRGVSE